jgi:hypothetical protein
MVINNDDENDDDDHEDDDHNNSNNNENFIQNSWTLRSHFHVPMFTISVLWLLESFIKFC